MKPEYVEVKNKKYKINSDYRIALECELIAKDESINDYERALAIIYKLFGDIGLNDKDNWNELLELAVRYLKCDKEVEEDDEDEPNMDFYQDKSFIEASFRSDYKIDLEKENMHWWTFCDLLNGLTENCVLNRVRYIRDYDISKIKDEKEKKKWIKQKEAVALNRQKRNLDERQIEQSDKFYKSLNGGE